MKNFFVSLFGHREIEDLWQMEDSLIPIIRELIQTKQFVTFLIGRNGEFDEYAASVIKRVQKEMGNENSQITLVLPYPTAKLSYYEAYYDDIILPEKIEGLHPKLAITARNQWMVTQSALVLAYLEHNRGGAYRAVKYAKAQNKRIIYLSKAF